MRNGVSEFLKISITDSFGELMGAFARSGKYDRTLGRIVARVRFGLNTEQERGGVGCLRALVVTIGISAQKELLR